MGRGSCFLWRTFRGRGRGFLLVQARKVAPGLFLRPHGPLYPLGPRDRARGMFLERLLLRQRIDPSRRPPGLRPWLDLPRGRGPATPLANATLGTNRGFGLVLDSLLGPPT